MNPGGYVFAGGGTGGHLFPAIALADALRARDPQTPIRFIGSDRPLERRICSDAGYQHIGLTIPSSSTARSQPVKYAVRFWRALRDARTLIRQAPPRVVIGCGGFTSVPAVTAALRNNIPVALLEQNLLPGRATRWLSRRSAAVCLAFEESRRFLSRRAPAVVTGNPLRSVFGEAAPRRQPQTDAHPTLLVLGGSLGAEEINQAILAGLATAPADWTNWKIVHQTGERDCEPVQAFYRQHALTARVEPFLHDVPQLLGHAQLVVMRAGATSLAEAACAGAPCVVVPWKRSADDHQTLNARWYADRGAVLIGEANPADGGSLWSQLRQLRKLPDLREQLSARILAVSRPQATQAVLQVIDRLAAG